MWFKLVLLFLCTSLVICDNCTVSDYKKLDQAIKICKTITIKDLRVPAKTTLMLDLRDSTTLNFAGRTTFEFSRYGGYLITIKGNKLKVNGNNGHVIDGEGAKYWRGHNTTEVKPFFMSIEATNSEIKNLKLLNSPKNCVSIKNSKNLYVSNFLIDSRAGDPGVAKQGYEAKNTDGFDINYSDNVTIEHSVVYNQDDCVAINNGKNYYINDVECHGSHGLSLSVGFGTNKPVLDNTVSNAHFKNCRMFKGDNGIQVKTHNNAGEGLITDLTYEDITFKDVEKEGIYIHENYPSGEAKGNVPIKNLIIKNVHGTMSGKTSRAVHIVCGSGGCFNWKWSKINITGANTKNECNFTPGGFKC